MENKYYTPTIDEFYIGFEYEELNENCRDYSTIIYGSNPEIPILDSDESSIYSIEEQLNNNELRVKYLDKEDIESLGFKCTSIYDTYSLYENCNYDEMCKDGRLIVSEAEKYITLKVIGTYVEIRSWCYHDNVYFKGNIKNKSEFKKLLTQLHIK